MLNAVTKQCLLQNTQRGSRLADMNRASYDGDLDRVTELFESNRQWSQNDLHGFLRRATEGGHIAVCRLLLEKGANVGSAPLYATEGNTAAVIELFMEYGWNINDAWLTVSFPSGCTGMVWRLRDVQFVHALQS
jgi:hypothetical protein